MDDALSTESLPLDTRASFVSVRDLVREYKVGQQRIRAVNDVSFDIKRGEFVAIVGVSGSGKSTLLQMIGGIDKPTSGHILVDGLEISTLHDRRLAQFRNQTIGFVFQSFYLQPFLSLRRNIEIAAMPNRMERKKRNERVERLATIVGLSDRLNHRPKELSGGQIQRAAIARALLNEPDIILADEPTGNLDPKNSREIIDLFRYLQQNFGTTIIVATHDQDVAAHADRIITMAEGAIYD